MIGTEAKKGGQHFIDFDKHKRENAHCKTKSQDPIKTPITAFACVAFNGREPHLNPPVADHLITPLQFINFDKPKREPRNCTTKAKTTKRLL
eukprot:6464006-Amphidinium_carterae.2